MNVSPTDFERLTTGWLIVDGVLSAELGRRTQQIMQRDGIPVGSGDWWVQNYGAPPLQPVTWAPLDPPADLVALVGEECFLCEGRGHIQEQEQWNGRTVPCPDCLGSGSALLTVTTDARVEFRQLMTPRGYEGVYSWFQGDVRLCDHEHNEDDRHICEDARSDIRPSRTRSVRVRLTGQPVPIVEPATHGPMDLTNHILVSRDPLHAVWWFHPKAERINLGSDPASLVGRWAFPVEQMT